MTRIRIILRPGESWEDAARRYARPHGLEEEVASTMRALLHSGEDAGSAAFHACDSWDVLEPPEEVPELDSVPGDRNDLRIEKRLRDRSRAGLDGLGRDEG